LRLRRIPSSDGQPRIHISTSPPRGDSSVRSEAAPSRMVRPIARTNTLEWRYGCRPGVHPDGDPLGELVASTASPAAREEYSAIVEQQAQYHPTEPYWYLSLVGVDPAYQGRGHGDALMAYALERCDRDKLPVYLYSTNPRNISLYRRHGFELLGTTQAGSSPPFLPMLRRPRGSRRQPRSRADGLPNAPQPGARWGGLIRSAPTCGGLVGSADGSSWTQHWATAQ
jgi:GNAT superfamily N-acetyltransferase